MDWKSPQVAALGAKLMTTTAIMLGFISASDSSRLESVLAAALVSCVGLVGNLAAVIHFNHTQQPQADARDAAGLQRTIAYAELQNKLHDENYQRSLKAFADRQQSMDPITTNEEVL